MKKLFLLISMAAAVSFAGCQKNEIDGVDNTNKEGSTFELVAEITQTKTTLDGFTVEWEVGDIIYMVTSDGTWGAPYAEDKNAATIAEFAYAGGKFTSEATIADGEYTFKGMYAAASQKSFHRGASTTHKLEATQTQDCANPTAHIKNNDALVGTFTATTPMTEPATVDMKHIYTMMQVDVKNNTGAEIEVTKFEMTAEGADLAGIFNVDAFDTPAISTKSGASSTIAVNVTGGTVANNASLPVYFVMAPLTDYSGEVTFKVTDANENTYTKTVNLIGITFAAGKYNTTPYTISAADEVEPEPASVTWDLTAAEHTSASEAEVNWTSDYVNMTLSKNTSSTKANNYLGGDNAHTRVYKDQILSFESVGANVINKIEIVSTTTTYAGYWTDATWSDGVTVSSTGTNVTITPDAATQSVSVTIGSATRATSITVYYTGGETPEPKTLVSIAVENPETEYTVGDLFVEPTVKATYNDESTAAVTGAIFSGNDLTSEGTKEVTVSYTEGEVTVTTSYEIIVSAPVVDDSDYSGTYAIVAYRNSESLYYYLTNEETSTSTVRLTAVSAGANKPVDNVEVDGSKLWIVSKTGTVYTIQSVASGEYVSWTSGNSATMSETGLSFTVSKLEDGTFNFKNETRYLSLNSSKGNDYFAMYGGTQVQNLYLIKAVDGEEAPATLESIQVSGQKTQFTVGDEFEFGGTVTATYSDGSTEDVTASAEFTDCNMSAAGTYDVTVSYSDKTTTYSITVSAAQGGGDDDDDTTDGTHYVKVTSTPADWSGTYLIVYENSSNAYIYTGVDAANNYVSAAISDNAIARSTDIDAVAVSIEQSGTGYSIKITNGTNSGKYISGGSSNGTTFGSTAVANTITLNSDGTVKINNNSTTSLQFNSAVDQMRFRYFKSSQKAVCLYKLN